MDKANSLQFIKDAQIESAQNCLKKRGKRGKPKFGNLHGKKKGKHLTKNEIAEKIENKGSN